MPYRKTRDNPAQGELHVLTPRQVQEIKQKKIKRKNLRKQLDKLSDRALGDFYNVGKSTIGRIR